MEVVLPLPVRAEKVEGLAAVVVLLEDRAANRWLHFRAPSHFQVPSHYHCHSRCRSRCRSQLEGIWSAQWPPDSEIQGQRLFQRMDLASELEMGMEPRHHCPCCPCCPYQNQDQHQLLHFHFQDLLHCCHNYPYRCRFHLGFRIPRRR